MPQIVAIDFETANYARESAIALGVSVIRDHKVRHPVLAWVESAFLTNKQDRDALRRDLDQAGFEGPSAPTIYVAIRFSLAVALPILRQCLVRRPLVATFGWKS